MSDYGDSSTGRVYERLERVFEVGLGRIETRLEAQGQVLDEMRERVTRLEERSKGMTEVRDQMKEMSERVDALERNRALERGLALGAGAGSGGLIAWLASFLGGTPPS